MPSSPSVLLYIQYSVGLLLLGSQPYSAQLVGNLIACTGEGPYFHPLIADDPCIHCFCQSGIVNCTHRGCPDLEGCHNIVSVTDCCKKSCLGCTYKNITIRSGETKQDDTDICTSLQCHGGVLTRTRDACYTPCKKPITIPGRCCPVCEGCVYKNQAYVNEMKFTDSKDPCVKCQCKDGVIECKKRACPQLNCPEEFVAPPRQGSCCATCTGGRSVFRPKNTCLYHPLKEIFNYGAEITKAKNRCQSCNCENGTVVCAKETCPRFKCKNSELLPPENGECCQRCPPPKKKCKVDGRKLKDGTVWHKNQCTKCMCVDGARHCWRKDCRSVISNCPKRTHELQYIGGLCCPQCIEISATCFVFGDPHYRTFDGLLYTFQGTCKYTLAEQCSSNKSAFSIQVKNSAWPDKIQYAYTDSVFIVTNKDLEIELKQQLQVKINNHAVRLPYIKLGQVSIIQRGYSLVVTTNLGVTVIWDGLSYVEVSVPQRYKNKMCGLCGNYNGISEDELIGRYDINYSNPVDFANSWQRGISSCAVSSSIYSNQLPMSNCRLINLETIAWIEKQCDALKEYVVKSRCRTIENIYIYFNECIDKLCTCNNPKLCYCQSARSLLKACQPLNNDMTFRNDMITYCSAEE